MIRGIQEDEFAYVPTVQAYESGIRVVFDIKGDEDDQGAGMYWYISPPLPGHILSQMHAYTGSICNYDCGKVDDWLVSTAQGQISMRAVVLAAALFGFAFSW